MNILFRLSLFQIAIVLLAIYYITSRVHKFLGKEKTQSWFKLFTTIFVWGWIGVISIYPPLAYSISRTLGLGESLFTLIFSGFIVVFLVLFKFLSVIETIERNITKLVRGEALKSVKLEGYERSARHTT